MTGLIDEIVVARAEYDAALERGRDVRSARSAYLFLLEAYYNATVDEIRPTLNSIRVRR